MGDAFYTEQGRIKDVDQAHEVANLVVDKGTKVAEARELELKRQTETGLTDEERNNLAIMAGVKEKHPGACDSWIDNRGREFLRIGHEKASVGHEVYYFTQHGLVLIEPYQTSPDLIADDVVDLAARVPDHGSEILNTTTGRFVTSKMDLANRERLNIIRTKLVEASEERRWSENLSRDYTKMGTASEILKAL